MRSARLCRTVVRLPLCVLAIGMSSWAAGCASAASESGDTSIAVEVTATAVTVENKTGSAFSKGEVLLIPQGIPVRYSTLITHMSNGEKRTFQLDAFRAKDGTPYRRNVANIKSVRVEATDIGGKALEREVPFK
jgi:hypothetical protein